MAFIATSTTFTSFAEYQDVLDRDSRLLEANEGLDEITIEDMLIRASEKILSRIRATDWWKDYQFSRRPSLKNDPRLVPEVNALNIIARKGDFTDLCVYHAFEEFILPRVADFSSQESAEYQKILFYKEKASDLFKELIEAGDWYDFDGNGEIVTTEKAPSRVNLVRVR